jgi:hypothetical protein
LGADSKNILFLNRHRPGTPTELTHTRFIPQRNAPGSCWNVHPWEGVGNAGCPMHPQHVAAPRPTMFAFGVSARSSDTPVIKTIDDKIKVRIKRQTFKSTAPMGHIA